MSADSRARSDWREVEVDHYLLARRSAAALPGAAPADAAHLPEGARRAAARARRRRDHPAAPNGPRARARDLFAHRLRPVAAADRGIGSHVGKRASRAICSVGSPAERLIDLVLIQFVDGALMPHSFYLCDVFTDRPFAGNQLAVVTDAVGLSDETMQRIAREFNFSETTF